MAASARETEERFREFTSGSIGPGGPPHKLCRLIAQVVADGGPLSVAGSLDALGDAGYRLSDELRSRLLATPDEAGS